ncbi:fungal hydrophobin [Agaricus bisporus var. burnettii]|uniref:Hydrophobin n=1 Tax=Agaricus bisporus var. burnettii TaxID=192524 RepID=A0A8H7EX07_AGABI|nr:fungal hydrophobin [Agaricus bisporus var. burnettii]
MYSKFALSVVSVFALSAAVAASPTGDIDSPCDVGTFYCCHGVQDAHTSTVTKIALLLHIDLGNVTGPVGLSCRDDIDSSSCTDTQPLCCTGENFLEGIIVAGCSSISL